MISHRSQLLAWVVIGIGLLHLSVSAQNRPPALPPGAKEIMTGDLAAVQRLFRGKALPAGWEEYSESPLTVAIEYGQQAVAEFFIGRGDNPNAANAMGELPLALAVGTRDEKLVALLLDKGAFVGEPDPPSFLPRPLPLLIQALVAEPPRRFGGPLRRAAAVAGAGNRIATLLLAKGAEVKVSDPAGVTPLMLAAKTGDAVLVQAMLDKDADPKAVEKKRRQTALHYAVQGPGETVVKTLLKAAPELVNQPDVYGQMPLHLAVKRGSREAAAALLAMGAQSSPLSHAGETPLSLAETRNASELVTMLKAHRAERRLFDREVSVTTAWIVFNECDQLSLMALDWGGWANRQVPPKKLESWADLVQWPRIHEYIPETRPLWRREGKDIFGRPYRYGVAGYSVCPDPETLAALRDIAEKITHETGRQFWPWGARDPYQAATGQPVRK